VVKVLTKVYRRFIIELDRKTNSQEVMPPILSITNNRVGLAIRNRFNGSRFTNHKL
jgi:hypothetical protein